MRRQVISGYAIDLMQGTMASAGTAITTISCAGTVIEELNLASHHPTYGKKIAKAGEHK